jgi:hypothetical protein
MNFSFQSGWLHGDATEAWRPAVAGRLAQRVLTFELRNKDSRGAEVVHRVVVDETGLIERAGPHLTSGRTVLLHGELISRPVTDQRTGFLKGYVREIRALAIEIPNRARMAPEEAEGAPEAAV